MGALIMLIHTGTEAAAADGPAPGDPTRSWLWVSGLLATRYEAVWNVNPAVDRPDDHNESRPLAYLATTLSVRPINAIEGVVTLASREISRETLDDGTVEDRWAATRFIDEAWIKVSRGSAWLKAGKQRLVVGRGLVLDSYQPAVSGSVAVTHESPRLHVKAFGAGLDQDGVPREGQSLYGGVRVDVSHPTAGRVSFSVSRLWDRNAMIPTLLPTNVRLTLNDEVFRADDGSLTYWIVDGATEGGRWSLDAVAVVQTGALNGVLNNPLIPPLSRARSITLVGKAGEVVAAYDVSERVTIRALGLYTSGDQRGPIDLLQDQRDEAFVGIYPFIDATNLFFNGGIDSTFTSGTPGASGVLGRGVLAGALTAVATIDQTTLRVVAADLWSEFPATNTSGRHYGVEFDTEWAYAVTDRLTARLEGDVLIPGSFYRSTLAPDPEPVYKLAAGLDLAW